MFKLGVVSVEMQICVVKISWNLIFSPSSFPIQIIQMSIFLGSPNCNSNYWIEMKLILFLKNFSFQGTRLNGRKNIKFMFIKRRLWQNLNQKLQNFSLLRQSKFTGKNNRVEKRFFFWFLWEFEALLQTNQNILRNIRSKLRILWRKGFKGISPVFRGTNQT